MRDSKFLLSAMIILAIFVSIISGLVMMVMPWHPELKHQLSEIIISQPRTLLYGGMIATLFGLILLIILLRLNRRLYLHVEMGGQPVSFDTKALEDYLSIYWKQRFPQHKITPEVVVNKNKLHIIAKFNEQPSFDENSILEQCEEDISQTLANNFKYSKPFIFTVDIPGK
ncbi:MAG: hypothetical protein ACQEP8_03725 [Chlamydiota bacterium]